MGMPCTYHEPTDYNDPLSILLAAEAAASDDLDDGVDALHSMYVAAAYRSQTAEAERVKGDMLGASPSEIAARAFRDVN